MKTTVTYNVTMPAMPMNGGAGYGYAPADDYSMGSGMFSLVES